MSDPKPIPDRCQQAAEQFIARSSHSSYKGNSVLMCEVCGCMEWRSSYDEPAGVTVRWWSDYRYNFNERPCPSCLEVRVRAPELASWVYGCIAMLEARLEKK